MQTAKIIKFPGAYVEPPEPIATRERGVRPSHGNVRCKVRDVSAIDDALWRVHKALKEATQMVTDLKGMGA